MSFCSNPFLKLANPILRLALMADSDDKEMPLIEAFERFEHHAFQQQLSSLAINHVKYALAAFVDEIMLADTSKVREHWMKKSLQLRFFGEHTAGEGFFTRLTQLRSLGEQYIDVLEIYFVCLQLGFQGIYRVRGLEKLLALQVELRGQIELIRGVIDPALTSINLLAARAMSKVSDKLPFWIIASTALMLLVLIYLGFTVAIEHKINAIRPITNIAGAAR